MEAWLKGCGLLCADVSLTNYSLTHLLTASTKQCTVVEWLSCCMGTDHGNNCSKCTWHTHIADSADCMPDAIAALQIGQGTYLEWQTHPEWSFAGRLCENTASVTQTHCPQQMMCSTRWHVQDHHLGQPDQPLASTTSAMTPYPSALLGGCQGPQPPYQTQWSTPPREWQNQVF